MQRPIKFRAWLKEEKKMVAITKLSWDESLILVTDGGQITLMQYTGLKDKNGKEIYEGDIVKSYTEYPLTLHTHHLKYMIIKFDCGYFGVMDAGTSGGFVSNIMMLQPDDWFNLEVIGNIYENPELSEGK